ncbi:excitatory amino acid transporter 3 [Brachionus plicatilis]|uniref:Amino acid transporter n=1 Tax=Brachionus plicatilis TaxID=10195 RepID=A0A3M7QP38_BRAPC|nr:excitatory amino acid transporter 3 [Brachionus plicatilis]
MPCKIKLKNVKKHFKSNLLLILTVIAVLLGVGFGILIKDRTHLSQIEKDYFAFPGEIFLRILKFLIFPLIASSLLSSIDGIQKSQNGWAAVKAVLFYLLTTITSIVIAVIMCISIKPGIRSRNQNDTVTVNSTKSEIDQKYVIVNTIFDLIRNLFPDNMIQVGLQLYQSNVNVSSNNEYFLVAGFRSGLNIIGLAFYTSIFGIVVSKMENKGDILIKLSDIIYESCINIITIVMYSPVANFFLVCNVILNIKNVNELFVTIPFYILTLFVTLISQAIVVGLIYLILVRKNIFLYLKNILTALMMAFATSSSAASLPITIKCVEQKNKITKAIARFMLTVGTSINVDGTTMYTLVAALFIAQFNQIDLSSVDIFVVSVTAAFASIGSAGIPAGATLALLASLSALNIPEKEITIFLSLDWLMDRFFTVHNVWGASIGTAVVDHYSKKKTNSEKNVQDKSNASELEQSQISNEVSIESIPSIEDTIFTKI